MSLPTKSSNASQSSPNVMPSVENFREWTAIDVDTFLSSKGFSDDDDEGKSFKTELVKLLYHSRNSVSKGHNYKIFNDCIHGHIEMHPLCISIIDTVQFQRLRQIKQMGCSYFVYPGAAHNRFEHSIGVSHLAGKLAKTLQERQPELEITDQDVLCVEIAGLCHDIGHGPFSHVFDGVFMPLVVPNSTWKHEEASVKMFDHLVKENNLMEKFQEHGLNETDITFIKEQIYGPLDNENYVGRPDKAFLYEIVANKRTGIDVDKLDYFARDCYMLGIANSFDYERYMKFAKVMKVLGQYQICTRDKEVYNLYSLFQTRYNLHRSACQHKVTKIIEIMICEALKKANDHFKIKGENGKMLKMSEAIHDMTAYTKMTDSILYEILKTDDDELQESRDIITNVLERKIYKCVGRAILSEDNKSKPEKIVQEIVGLQEKLGKTPILTDTDLIILIVNFTFGMGSKNPVDSVRFYSKHNPEEAVKIRKSEVSKILPEKFSDQEIRLYCKKRDDESVKIAFSCFQKWCEDKKCNPKAGNIDPELTPVKFSPVKSTPHRQHQKTEGHKRNLFQEK